MPDASQPAAADVEAIYEALAQGVDRARQAVDAGGDSLGAARAVEAEALFLAKLALAALRELGSAQRTQGLIDAALRDLALSLPEDRP
ncbi:hypothetical protein ACFOGJ_15075 [Marinibaculum pumilum]|uniref:Uncharacterized protein n=1 Tax=Marinibaculum pumilum TaxID=1766165 RepID=A0ABV7L1P7_9PROT